MTSWRERRIGIQRALAGRDDDDVMNLARWRGHPCTKFPSMPSTHRPSSRQCSPVPFQNPSKVGFQNRRLVDPRRLVANFKPAARQPHPPRRLACASYVRPKAAIFLPVSGAASPHFACFGTSLPAAARSWRWPASPAPLRPCRRARRAMSPSSFAWTRMRTRAPKTRTRPFPMTLSSNAAATFTGTVS